MSGSFLNPEEPKRVIEEITKNCGHIDSLVCNHALSGNDGVIGGLNAEMLDKHWVINTRSCLLLAQYFANQINQKTPYQINDRGSHVFALY